MSEYDSYRPTVVTNDMIARECGDIFYEAGIAAEIDPSDTSRLKDAYFEYFYKQVTSVEMWRLALESLRKAGFDVIRVRARGGVGHDHRSDETQ